MRTPNQVPAAKAIAANVPKTNELLPVFGKLVLAPSTAVVEVPLVLPLPPPLPPPLLLLELEQPLLLALMPVLLELLLEELPDFEPPALVFPLLLLLPDPEF